jgi:hypothetical protein
MRVMVLVKADKNSEAGVLPDEKLLTEMGQFNEELVKAGVMLAGEGLHPSSKGIHARAQGAGGAAARSDGREEIGHLGGALRLASPDR